MRLSRLQQFILMECASVRGACDRLRFSAFYASKSNRHTKNITRSIEHLIDRELMIGEGVRTPHKWYMRRVRLTPKGKVAAKKLGGEQRVLPFLRASSK